jgi:hypothetical protein
VSEERTNKVVGSLYASAKPFRANSVLVGNTLRPLRTSKTMQPTSAHNGKPLAIILLLFALLAIAPVLRAQQPPPMAATAPSKPPTLAQALAMAAVPTDGIALTVSPETVPLPPGSKMPDPGTSVNGCAERFGMIYGSFGAVTYLAPAGMTLLNDDPGEPDTLPQTGGFLALKILAGSLDNSQWQALTSSGGLGLSDLTSPQQEQLFLDLFPNHQLKVAPEGTTPDPATATDLSADIPQVHIRLSQTAILMPSSINGDTIGTHGISEDAPGQTRWVTVRTQATPITQEAGQTAKAIVPNRPKSSQLDYDQTALQTPVPLQNIATVGDLVKAVRQASGLEIYADPHYAQRTVVIVGSLHTATGKDLLRAVAICLTATFRKVGPAYALTDDLPGVGAIYKIWADFADRANKSVMDLEGQAGNALDKNHSLFDLPTFGDPVASTPQQETPDPNTPGGQIYPESPVPTIAPFAGLTPAQQQAAHWVAQRYSAQNAAEIAKDPAQAPDMNGKWTVEPQYRLEALAPSFPDPIQLSRQPLGMLSLPSDAAQQQRRKDYDKWKQKHATKKALTLPTLAAELAKVPNRAVLAAPQDAADIAPLVQGMKALGLNQLWLYVEREGVARVPGTPLTDENGGDLLAAALAATRGTRITVYPVMDILTWGIQPPDGTADLDILGETSVQAQDRAKAVALELDPDMPPLPGTVVSPDAQCKSGRTDLAVHAARRVRPAEYRFRWRRLHARDASGLPAPFPRRSVGHSQQR